MLMPRGLVQASKQRPCLALAARLYCNNGCSLRPLTLRRGKNSQTKTEVGDNKDGTRSSTRRKSPRKKPSIDDTKPHESDAKAATAPSPFDLTLSSLQELARTLGVSQTGPKPALTARLQGVLRNHSPPPADARILSIDLGIRNLAYALLTPPPQSTEVSKPTVHAWTRVDLRSLSPLPVAQNPLPSQDDFSPASLSSLALKLVQTHLLPLNPTHVLIERQRFRSGGGSAVLEWTVRVNSLESMLYAIFAAFRSTGRFDGAVIPVDPRRVGPFLLEDEAGEGGTEGKNGGRKAGGSMVVTAKGSKENKKLKIALVGRWLRDRRGVQFEGQSEGMKKAFLNRWLPKEKKSKADKGAGLLAGEEKGGNGIEKLDDVADCLLQGVAWLRWERNKRKLVEELAEQS